MKTFKPKLERWYDSKNEVRAAYGEYWKGILLKENQIAVIFNFEGARRIHYGDALDYEKGEITYIGEGKQGDQTLNARNKALCDACAEQKKVDVFLDCGDIFKPKKILYAGKWLVSDYIYKKINTRKVYQYRLIPSSTKIIDFLHFTFNASSDKKFEHDLENFATSRAKLYNDHSGIMRTRDNIIGEIGEYFCIKEFNKKETNPLVRLTSAFKDIDAISIKSGKRYAIKTIGKFPFNTSNIWSKDIETSIDYFLICHLHPEKLKPIFICMISAKKAKAFLRKDNYQGSNKLKIDESFVRASKILYGKLP